MSDRKPTAAQMTRIIGEVTQILPPRRRAKPSLPAVSLEGIRKNRMQPNLGNTTNAPPAARKLTAEEQAAWVGDAQQNVGFLTDGKRIWVEENTTVGAGARKEGRRSRVLSTVEGMHRAGTCDFQHWQASRALADGLLQLIGGSEGVSTYGNHPGDSDPAGKADRRGHALTGYAIDSNSGQLATEPSAMATARRNRTKRSEVAELLFAAVGVENCEGRRELDEPRAIALVQAVVGTTSPPTLGEIGSRLTAYGGEKQQTAAAATMLREWLQRMALHLQLKKGSGWDDRGLDRIVRNVKV